MITYDRRTIDSTGAFLIGELERLDQTPNPPLASITWTRDIDVREDVTMADEFSSWTNSTFASPGGITPTGKAWISRTTNAITGVDLDIGKTAQPLHLWGMELKYTLPELESSIKLGRPVDTQKYDAIQMKHQMDIDETVYVGDSVLGFTGLINSTAVATTNAAAVGTGSSSLWTAKTPQQILNDINTALGAAWEASGWAVMPTEVRLPPGQYQTLAATIVSSAGNMNLINYLGANSVANSVNGRPLNIQPLKWLRNAGAGGLDRMLIYTRDRSRLRFPLVPLQRTPIENRSIYQITTYYGRLGQVEIVYPETIAYVDGI